MKTKIKIGLNGFGRIGRAFTRIALTKNTVQIEAINTSKTPPSMLAYLLQYDSIYRTFDKTVKEEKNGISVEGKFIASYMIPNPKDIPWNKHEIDIVIDCTGVFKKFDELSNHLKKGVKKVILCCPTKDEKIPHIVLGVNDDNIKWIENPIISNASCTTNCVCPMLKIINDAFSIRTAFITTAHAYTITQQLLDNASKDFTRSRAATLSIVPSTTGSADAVERVIPSLAGKIDGIALRVPVPTGSFSDVTIITEKKTTEKEINSLFEFYSKTKMHGILGYSDVPLVSSDFIGSPFSCIYDSNYTKVMDGTFIKVFGWYDNEWGFSARLVELAEKIGSL